MNTVVSTGAVLLTWMLVVVVLTGCGVAIRRSVVSTLRLKGEPHLCIADIWTGLAALLALLMFWSVFAEMDWRVWIAPVVVAAVGLYVVLRDGIARPSMPPTPVAVATAALVVLLANFSLGDSTDYDSGLYHFSAIEWASDGAAQPGLGNLHVRLASAGGHLLFVSSLGIRPWTDAGQHVANGLIAALLLIHAVAGMGRFHQEHRRTFSWTLALLMVPSMFVVLGTDISGRISSPSLDAPIFLLVLASALSVAQGVERQLDPRYLLGAGCALAAGLATRLYLALAILVLALVVMLLARRRASGRLALTGLIMIPALVVTASVAVRQAILSGYPLFPTSVSSVPVDWRVPEGIVHAYREEVAAWAQDPGNLSREELWSWGWLRPWLDETILQADIISAALVVLMLVPPLVLAALLWWRGDIARRLPAAVAVLAPACVSLVFWFLTAPDPRFALGWICLVAIGSLALVMPAPVSRILSMPTILVVVFLWFTAGVALTVSEQAALVRADGAGPLGTHPPPIPETTQYQTKSGLILSTPVHGDRCWTVELCTPSPTFALRLRGDTPDDGFSVQSK